MSDEHCIAVGLPKPPEEEICNTQSCTKAVADTANCVQDSVVYITHEDLLANDITRFPPSRFVGVSNPIGGTVENKGTYVEFHPNVKTGEVAGFNYTIADSLDYESTGHVTVNILPLSTRTAYIFSHDELMAFKAVYQPPSLAQIFNEWSRYCEYPTPGSYYPSGTPPQGEAASWEMISSSQFRCTVNSNAWTGFISPSKLDNYVHWATFSSTDDWNDDDFIGLVIAFKHTDDGTNHALIAVRVSGFSNSLTNLTDYKGWAIIYAANNASWTVTGLDANGHGTILIKAPTASYRRYWWMGFNVTYTSHGWKSWWYCSRSMFSFSFINNGPSIKAWNWFE